MNRLHNHIQGNDLSAAWVRRCGFEELVETRACFDERGATTTEVGLTVQYKMRFGWDHVRGGCDINVNSSRAAQPGYWEAPEDGLLRNRSRSPIGDQDGGE